MVVDEPTDRALAPYIDGTPPSSFERLYADAYVPMVRLAFLLTGSASSAEELVQDAFVRVFARWGDVESPHAYLRQAVVNACHSHHRRRGRELRHGPGAATRARVADVEVDLTRQALDTLPERQRKAVVLRYYEDLSEAQIAEVLGCRPGTVKSLLSRAMTRLRKVLPDV
jgi:RNA polymerase sigma-70 factor (sigma-E family)